MRRASKRSTNGIPNGIPNPCHTCQDIADLIRDAGGPQSNHLLSDVASLIRVLRAVQQELRQIQQARTEARPYV